MIILAASIDAQENFLGQVLRLFGARDEVVHDADEALVVKLDQLGERFVIVGADAQHEPDFRITDRHLVAAFADERHGKFSFGVSPRAFLRNAAKRLRRCGVAVRRPHRSAIPFAYGLSR